VNAAVGFLSERPEGTRLFLKVQPRARGNEIGPATGDVLKIRVTAPPVDSAANEAVIKLLAKQLDCAKGSIRLVGGRTSRGKVVAVRGMTVAEILERLPG
jgi:uncharacterized protein (TIGR00251 family)